MTDRCQIPRCRGEVELIYLDRGVCEKHWMELAADDAPLDALRMVLGLEVTAPSAMRERTSDNVSIATKTVATEETMAVKKKTAKRTTKTAPKKKATARKVTPKKAAPKPKAATGDKPNRVFAIRVTDKELAAIHRAAGPRNATRFIRAVAAAFASADEAAFRSILKEAAQARG